MASRPEMEGSLIMLWAGEDPALHSALLEELQAADIPFVDKPTGRDEVAPTADPLPIDWRPRFGFEVAVLSSDYAAAEKILEKLLEQEPIDMELAAVEASAAAGPTPEQQKLSKATSAVWSGEDQERAEFLSQALRENEVLVRVEKSGKETTLYVPPEEETQAREIIREIVEGAPPA
jgi:hypothetical protein